MHVEFQNFLFLFFNKHPSLFGVQVCLVWFFLFLSLLLNNNCQDIYLHCIIYKSSQDLGPSIFHIYYNGFVNEVFCVECESTYLEWLTLSSQTVYVHFVSISVQRSVDPSISLYIYCQSWRYISKRGVTCPRKLHILRPRLFTNIYTYEHGMLQVTMSFLPSLIFRSHRQKLTTCVKVTQLVTVVKPSLLV